MQIIVKNPILSTKRSSSPLNRIETIQKENNKARKNTIVKNICIILQFKLLKNITNTHPLFVIRITWY